MLREERLLVTERAAPFYCPYCGEEDLRPFGEQHGEWRCGACLRVFRLSYRGLTAPGFQPFDQTQEIVDERSDD